MKVFCILRKLKPTFVRWNSSKPTFKLKEELEILIEAEKVNPRFHPGIIKKSNVQLPEWIIKSMYECLNDTDRTKLFGECKKFSDYLFSRRLPLEDKAIDKIYSNIEQSFIGTNLNDLSKEELEQMQKKVKNKVTFKLKQKVFAWKSIEYNNYRSFLYMITRSVPEYSVMQTIFSEIQARDPDFSPRTIFDFGSGISSVLWAAINRWKDITEYYGVDISNDMNDLSQKIMSNSPLKFKGLFYRQYLPISNRKYDVTVSAYSLMELPNAKARLEVIAKLWKKTEQYLIIVEQGTNAGFQVINEARDFINHVMQKFEPDFNYFTFAPCPHDTTCPRYVEGKTPCNFISNYLSLPILGPSKASQELFSYVILKKGKRSEKDNWSRLVRPTILRSKHVRCRLCTSAGKLNEIVITKSKHGKALYRCAKATKWSDRLPIELIPSVEVQPLETTDPSINSDLLEDIDKEYYKDEMEKKHNKELETYVSDTPFSLHKEES